MTLYKVRQITCTANKKEQSISKSDDEELMKSFSRCSGAQFMDGFYFHLLQGNVQFSHCSTVGSGVTGAGVSKAPKHLLTT